MAVAAVDVLLDPVATEIEGEVVVFIGGFRAAVAGIPRLVGQPYVPQVSGFGSCSDTD